MKSTHIHLVCNAHIDPVWLWEWEEGLAETLSTFRIAADFCEREEGFVFCHNESLLYQWVEKFDPVLFSRIRKWVATGKWKIMGGWYLQPDCNLPSGEAMVRQILVGRRYFKDAFGVEPTTAVNLDPFGHSRGLVQILKKSGYQSYLFCRPDADHLPLPSDDFLWVGYDGSQILAHRSGEHYNSRKGQVNEKILNWKKQHPDVEVGMILWGIGNHGGGPSRHDLVKIKKIQQSKNGESMIHSDPDAYFDELRIHSPALQQLKSDLNPWAVGCYTSMGRVKQRYRQLENKYLQTERMATHASLTGLCGYPDKDLNEALEDLLFVQFHDVLPGSSIRPVEESSIRRMDHGLEILSRIRTEAFVHLLAGQKQAGEGEFPILVYNPFPFEIHTTMACELQAQEPNFNPQVFLQPEIVDEAGQPVICQLEKEDSNIRNDHRKKVVFVAGLKPFSMNRFSCFLKEIPVEEISVMEKLQNLQFIDGARYLGINYETGLVESYRVDNESVLFPGSARLLVMNDYADPWGMKVNSFRDLVGEFRLMTPEESARFSAISTDFPDPVRVIEEGSVRTVVEALFTYHDSRAVVRYTIPKSGLDWEMELRIFWMEKDRMLKLSFATPWTHAHAVGQVMYGVQEFHQQARELVAQSWCGLIRNDKKKALTVINDRTYGFDYEDGELRISLLRSPAYAAHPINDQTPIVREDRFEPRMDQGEHLFRFKIVAGDRIERMNHVDHESQLWNEGLPLLCCFPSGEGSLPLPAVLADDPRIRLAALKTADRGQNYIIRLYNTVNEEIRTIVGMPVLNTKVEVRLTGYEVKTLGVNRIDGSVDYVNLMEE